MKSNWLFPSSHLKGTIETLLLHFVLQFRAGAREFSLNDEDKLIIENSQYSLFQYFSDTLETSFTQANHLLSYDAYRVLCKTFIYSWKFLLHYSCDLTLNCHPSRWSWWSWHHITCWQCILLNTTIHPLVSPINQINNLVATTQKFTIYVELLWTLKKKQKLQNSPSYIFN